VTSGTELVRRLVDAFVGGDTAKLDDLLTENYIQHNPTAGQGREAMKSFVADYKAAVPDLQLDVHDIIADADRVVARITHRGTQRGELFGLPATGRPFKYGTIDIWRVEDGRLAEHWDEVDMLGLMRQLNLLPDGGSE